MIQYIKSGAFVLSLSTLSPEYHESKIPIITSATMNHDPWINYPKPDIEKTLQKMFEQELKTYYESRLQSWERNSCTKDNQ